MNTLLSFYTSSVGKKLVVALTGLFLCTFLIVHLTINLFLFCNDGGETYNFYAEFMSTNPFIRTMEIVLGAGFILHILITVYLWYKNRRARPQGYALNAPAESSPLSSRITFITGSILFIFLVVHLQSFWLPARFGEGDYSMYTLVVTAFSDPWYDLFYLVALFLLGYHLRHGFQSAFQTFGIRHRKYITMIEVVGILFWLIIPLTFAAMPLYFLWLSKFGGMNTL